MHTPLIYCCLFLLKDIEKLSSVKSSEIGKMHYNKNRFQNIIPCKRKIVLVSYEFSLLTVDDNIVPLTPIKGKKGSDYINASYVNVSISLVLVIY